MWKRTHFLTLLDVDIHTVCIALKDRDEEATFVEDNITEVQNQSNM